MILAIIVAWLAYKKAKEQGRNGIVWAIAGAATFVGTQVLVSFGLGVVLGFGIEALGWSETLYDTYSIPILVVAIVASFFTSWLLLRWLGKTPPEEEFLPPPPPPSDFNINN